MDSPTGKLLTHEARACAILILCILVCRADLEQQRERLAGNTVVLRDSALPSGDNHEHEPLDTDATQHHHDPLP